MDGIRESALPTGAYLTPTYLPLQRPRLSLKTSLIPYPIEVIMCTSYPQLLLPLRTQYPPLFCCI